MKETLINTVDPRVGSRRTRPGETFTERRVWVGPQAVDVRGTFTPQRTPIVLVHGIGMSGEYFLPFAEQLTADHDVYVVDLPGYGSTPDPVRALTVPELGEVVGEVIVALGLAAPVVVGHSMGCQVIANTIERHPGLCAGYLRMGPRRYVRTARHMLADRIEQSILGCAIPGCVVRGQRDPIAPHEWTRHLVRLAPEAGLLEIPGAPHAVQHTRPEELAAACAPFLAGITGDRSAPRTRGPRV